MNNSSLPGLRSTHLLAIQSLQSPHLTELWLDAAGFIHLDRGVVHIGWHDLLV